MLHHIDGSQTQILHVTKDTGLEYGIYTGMYKESTEGFV